MAPQTATEPAHAGVSKGAAAGLGPRPRVMVLHGPNLDLLGEREPAVYGAITLAELDARLGAQAEALGVELEAHQTNGEGAFIDLLHAARQRCAAVVVNPGGYTHTSVAIHDALRALAIPAVEVHLSNLYAREPMRHVSVTAAACRGVVMGLGPDSYLLALRHVVALIFGASDSARHGLSHPTPSGTVDSAPAATSEPA
ncbi:MAG: type II 3-dehydroquinate dehydratase [Nannocystaceae bacterium]